MACDLFLGQLILKRLDLPQLSGTFSLNMGSLLWWDC